MADLVLHNYFRSSASYRVRIALNLKNLKYEYRAVHLLKDGGEQHKPEYQRLNPVGLVPTLQDGNFFLSESVAIIDYLDNKYGGHRMFPLEPYQRARVLRFCEVINAGIQPLANLRVTQELEKLLPGRQDIREQWIQTWVGRGLKSLEALVSESCGVYCFGDTITAADAFLVPQVFSAERFKVDMKLYPQLMKITNKCLEHEAFQAAHPSKQPDYFA